MSAERAERELIKALLAKGRNVQDFSFNGEPPHLQSFPTFGAQPSTSQVRPKNLQAPPPVPPRPHASSHSSCPSTNRFSSLPVGLGSPYSYGMSNRALPYSNYGSYGGLNYGSRYAGYGLSGGYGPDVGNSDNIFIRMAEESSRPAFQSIESMVNVVGSISMMLESTYYAVHSSYRAVLGVVDQFSRLRNHLANMISTLALLRTFQWLCLKVLHYLGLRHANPSAEAAWSAATTAVIPSDGPAIAQEGHASWPIFMFMGVVFGAPWLIFRIFSRMAQKKAEGGNFFEKITDETQDEEIWHPQEQDKGKIVAMFDFKAAHPGEISVKRGQILVSAPKKLQPKTSGWTLVCVDPQTTGLVPTSYLRRVMKKPVASTSSASAAVTVPQELCATASQEDQPETFQEQYAEFNNFVEKETKGPEENNVL